MNEQLSDMLRLYLSAHSSMKELQNKLKAVKAERKALESRIAPLLSKDNVQIVDIGKYRVYRYDNRLVPYYLQQ